LAFHSGREANHSPPSSAEVKEWVEPYLHSPNTPSWRGAQLGRRATTLLLLSRRLTALQIQHNRTISSLNTFQINVSHIRIVRSGVPYGLMEV
jgi:hypothetical protein